MAENGSKDWREYFRLATPIGIFVLGVFISFIRTDISRTEKGIEDLNIKIFTHLTNEDIHIPRSFVVSQEAFTLYQTMRDKEMRNIENGIAEIKAMLKDGRR